MWLAIAHVAAAVFHHFVQRDDTLLRMLPPTKRNRFR
jgi:cytochrome b561